MAMVGKPKFGVKVEYTNKVKTTFWFGTEEARDRKFRDLNRSAQVKTAKRVSR
jgi:hypothetical protein